MHIDFDHQTRLYLGLYELELSAHLRRLCRPGHRGYDVGAQVGYDALVMAKLSGAPVASFEREAVACAALRANLALNPGVGSLVTAVQATVGERTDGDGHLALDDFARGPGGFVPDVVKIDVEGAEAAVLRGALEILSKRRPHLVVETHSAELERACGDLLVGLGYRPVVVPQRRRAPDLRPAGHNRWLVAAGVPPVQSARPGASS
jgi:hypothetical protein